MIKSEFHSIAKARHSSRVSFLTHILGGGRGTAAFTAMFLTSMFVWSLASAARSLIMKLGGSKRRETWWDQGLTEVPGKWHQLQMERLGHRKTLEVLYALPPSVRKASWWQTHKLHSLRNVCVGSLLMPGAMCLYMLRLWKRGDLILTCLCYLTGSTNRQVPK